MPWNPAQYARFAGHRLRPALDLLARVSVTEPREVVDLGCGSGNVTRVLREQWPEAAIVGVDSSEEMLAKAQGLDAGIEWVREDIGFWRAARPVDVLFSNAALHWVDRHERLIQALMGQLAEGGVLAVQMPRQWDAPSHTVVQEMAAHPAWVEHLARVARPWSHSPDRYFEWLAPAARSIDIWETTYLQVLEGEDAVAEWVKGTLLVPYLEALPEALRGHFEAEYRRRMAIAYPRLADGRTLFAYRRLFIVAQR
jgi:trans-aconitate 2-methyltransferase